ncbi:MAG: tetratricopeptide repeat protein, partial [Polyangiales bacterium]
RVLPMKARHLLFLAPLALAMTTSLPCATGDAFAQETKVAALKAETKAKPKDASAAFALGRALRRAGRWAEAKTELVRAATLSTGKDQVKARYELARVEFDQGVTNKSLPLPPSLATCKNVKIGKLGEAMSRLCAAEAWLTFARASMAEDELAAAAKIDPALYELKLGYAMVDVTADKHDDAVVKLKALSVATPTRAEAFRWLGHEYLALDKRADAIAPLKKALVLDADWPEIAFDLSRALPDGAEARDSARAAVAMKPTFPEAWIRLGELELATGGNDAAKAAFETGLKQNAKIAAGHIGLAWANLKLKKPEEAKKAAQEAIKLAGTSASARLVYGEALAAAGQLDEAIDAFKLAAGLDSKDPTGLVRAAEVLLAAKQPVKAEAHAESAVLSFPKDARCWLVLADVQLATGDKKEAKTSYQKALAAPQGTIDKAATQKKLDALK